MISIFHRWRVARALDAPDRDHTDRNQADRSCGRGLPSADTARGELARHRESIAQVDALLRAGAERLRASSGPSVAERVLARLPASAPPRTPPRTSVTRRARPLRVAALAAGLVIALAAGYWWTRSSPIDAPVSTGAPIAQHTPADSVRVTREHSLRGTRDLWQLSRSVTVGLRAKVEEPLIAEVENLGADATRAAQFLADRVARPWSSGRSFER
ncbi:MAG: hypothetical protein ACKVWV_04235 [Planctomycetota bacterium]